MAMEACGFAPGLCVFVVFVSRVYQTPAPTMPMLQQPRRRLRSVALNFLMQMLCEELQSPKASFATTCEHFGCRFRIFVVCLHTQRVPMLHKATTLHYVWIFKFMISDADSDIESEIPKYCTPQPPTSFFASSEVPRNLVLHANFFTWHASSQAAGRSRMNCTEKIERDCSFLLTQA